jgi:hypothetical protein
VKPGLVYFHEDYEHEDGELSDKLIVIVAAKDDCLLVLKTTSQPHGRSTVDGCHVSAREGVFTFNTQKSGFKKTPTWIVLRPRVFMTRSWNARIQAGQAKEIFAMRQDQLQAIINCLRRVTDISPAHLAYL